MATVIGKDIRAVAALSEPGIDIYKLPGIGSYVWIEDMKGIAGTWSPMCYRDHSIRQWFGPNLNFSVYESGAPFMQTYGYTGKNLTALALSDPAVRTKMTVSVDDLSQRDEVVFTLDIIDGGNTEPGESGEIYLRIDRRDIDYADAIGDAADWMRSFAGPYPVIPDSAISPLYSSWYNFHQEPEQGLLTRELRLASQLGFKTVILDDGWQFEGQATGDYLKAGDWEVAKDKFPDFKKFADDVHSFGMKLMVWFTVPFAGYATETFKQLGDKMAFKLDGMRAGVLDIRYREVRDHIIGVYERFVDSYGIDGLKLDFVDAWRTEPGNAAPYNEAMDIRSLDKAVRVLMREIYERMTAKNPEFLIEFRQSYIGAEILRNCNMLRVGDCAADPITNRQGIAAIRLLNGRTAPHSDMLLWSKTETPVNCMRQMLNILFSVPQISVLLTKVPEEQLKAVKRFVDYWRENRDILLGGRFRAVSPTAIYSQMSAEKDGRRISVLYEDGQTALSCADEDVWNCTANDYIVVLSCASASYRVFDWSGKELETGTINPGASVINVPAGGLVKIKELVL